MEDAIFGAVSSIGVPTAIAFFLLARVNSTLDRLNSTIIRLSAKIDQFANDRIEKIAAMKTQAAIDKATNPDSFKRRFA